MRVSPFVAIGGAALAAVVMVACSDSPSCTPGMLTLRLGLISDALTADTLTVVDDDVAGAAVQTFAHAPSTAPENIEHVTVDVAWPDGYPGQGLFHFTVRALAAGTVVAEQPFAVRLEPRCTAAELLLSDLAANY